MPENQLRALRIGQAVLDEREIQILVAAVKFVADDGVAEVREVDADLMFAAGAGFQAEEGKVCELRAEGWETGAAHLTPALSPHPMGGEGEWIGCLWCKRTRKSLLHPKFCLRLRAVRADAIFHGD